MAKRTRVNCGSHLSYDCRGFMCELPFGHDGDHIASGTSEEERTPAGSFTMRPVTYEMRWHRSEPTRG